MHNEWAYRRLRKEFKTTIADLKVNKYLLGDVVANRKNTVLYKEEDIIPIQEPREERKAKVSLKKKQATEAAYDLACSHAEIAVMDFMGTDSPYENGKEFTWEAELCRCTTLFPCLCSDLVQQKFYQHNKSRGNSLGSGRAIYIPEVQLFATESYRYPTRLPDEAFINVVGMAAPDMSRYQVEMDGSTLKEIFRKRIERSFEIAYANGSVAILTGAWGCGESQCPSDIVAAAYAEALKKWQYYFKEIVFTINAFESSVENDKIYKDFEKSLKELIE